MSTHHYYSRQTQNEDVLDELYQKLEHSERESETDLARNLTHSIKSLSRRWLQEAYLDGMMLADKLHQITSSNKNKSQDTQTIASSSKFATEKASLSTSNSNDIALIVRQELQKLGLTQTEPTKQNNGGFANFIIGSVLILSGFFIIGGALGYYGLNTQIANYISRSYASLTGANTNNPSDPDLETAKTQNTNSNNWTADTNQAIPPVASAPKTQSQEPETTGPTINITDMASNSAGNFQSLPSNQNSALANSNNTNSITQAQLPTESSSNNTTPTNQPISNNNNLTQTLPSSCNGQIPQVNRSLDMLNPQDRAILYCILDINAQNQSNQSALPNPSSVPQR